MGDRRVYVDDGGKQYYLDENGKKILIKSRGLHPTVQVAIVAAISAIVVAIIGVIPAGPSGKPFACGVNSSIINSILNCGDIYVPTPTPNPVETSVAVITLQAPTSDFNATSIAGTLTAQAANPTATNTTQPPTSDFIGTAVAATLTAQAKPPTALPVNPNSGNSAKQIASQETGNVPDVVTYPFTLTNTQFLVAEGWFLQVEGQAETHRACMTFLAIGPATFKLNMVAGKWYLWDDMTDPKQAEAVLEERTLYVESLAECSKENMKTVRFND